MRASDFEYLYDLEEHYWWFAAMRQITDAIVHGELSARSLRILDAGCGTGYNIAHYEKAGHSVFGLDVAPEAISAVCRRGFRKICQASVTQIPYASESFDLVFSFDVLEQITAVEGEGAIREMHRLLRPGGFLFVRVPAFEWLRSSHDDDLRTVHRYTRSELLGMLRRAGFSVSLATYANTFLFPIVVLHRILKKFGVNPGTDVKPLPRWLGWVDSVFRRVLTAEASFLGAKGSFPIGLSVICYARKPSGEPGGPEAVGFSNAGIASR